MSGLRIAAIRLRCPDPAATALFFVRAFGCLEERGKEDGGGRNLTRLRLGEQRLDLVPASLPNEGPAPSNSTAFQHFAIIVSDMNAAMARLSAVAGWSAISREGPEHLPAASGGATAFKFRDPDGHPLEFLQFPAGSMPDPWRSATGGESPCLGIDHTAITVADAERATSFYAELGFKLTERHINRGPEQARMDGLDDAQVEVVTLMPESGVPPHLELLRYRVPAAIPSSAPDGSPLATIVRLFAVTEVARALSDPDGHRIEIFTA